MVELRQQRRDVDAPVPRRVGGESATCLRQLPFATDSIAAAGLVPRDRDVYQPLQEVPLAGRGRSPRILELLVCREVLAAADQLEPARERRLAQLCRDLDLAVFHPDVERPQPDRAVELVLAGANVVLPSVPRARQHRPFEPAAAERPLEVHARVLDGEELTVDVAQRDCLLAHVDHLDRARWHLADTRDRRELRRGHAATLAARNQALAA